MEVEQTNDQSEVFQKPANTAKNATRASPCADEPGRGIHAAGDSRGYARRFPASRQMPRPVRGGQYDFLQQPANKGGVVRDRAR